MAWHFFFMLLNMCLVDRFTHFFFFFFSSLFFFELHICAFYSPTTAPPHALNFIPVPHQLLIIEVYGVLSFFIPSFLVLWQQTETETAEKIEGTGKKRAKYSPKVRAWHYGLPLLFPNSPLDLPISSFLHITNFNQCVPYFLFSNFSTVFNVVSKYPCWGIGHLCTFYFLFFFLFTFSNYTPITL